MTELIFFGMGRDRWNFLLLLTIHTYIIFLKSWKKYIFGALNLSGVYFEVHFLYF